MQENLKEFLDRNEADRKQYLKMFNAGTKMKDYVKNALLLFFTEQSKAELFLHIFILIIVGASFPAGYFVRLHLIFNLGLYAIGKFYLCRVWGAKLNKMEKECQKRLDEFTSRQYEENKIVKDPNYGGEDYVVYGDDTVIKSTSILSSIEVSCDPVSIYSLTDAREEAQYCSDRENAVDMKSKVASLEFNKNFGVLVKKNWEKEGMKFLSPSRKLNMLHSSDFAAVAKIDIANGKIKIKNKRGYLMRPNGYMYVYDKNSPLEKPFQEIFQYCSCMRKLTDEMYHSYIRIAEILQD